MAHDGPLHRAWGAEIAARLTAEEEQVALPPPQMQRRGPHFVPVPTAPVFGRDGAAASLEDLSAPMPLIPQPESHELLPTPDSDDRTSSDGSSGGRGILAEPARLSPPRPGQSWSFLPSRTEPLSGDVRTTPRLQRSLPKLPGKALQ